MTPVQTDSKSKKKQFVFKLVYRIEDEADLPKDEQPTGLESPPKNDDSKSLLSSKDAKKSAKKEGRKDDSRTGGKVAAVAVGGVMVGALTAGIGLLAGMMVVGAGAAAGGSALAMSTAADGKERVVTLACDTQDDAEAWVAALEATIQELAGNVLQQPLTRSKKGRAVASIHPEVRIDDVEDWIANTRWKVFDVFEGLRLLQPDSEEQALPCLRTSATVNAAAIDVFSFISNLTNSTNSSSSSSSSKAGGLIQSVRMVAHIDNNTDILHIKLAPVYLQPVSWTAPRDFCVLRYWRDHEGSYVICLDSTAHDDCPPLEGYVRGDLHAAYVITPPKTKMGSGFHKDDDDDEVNECLLTLIAQMDPRGWVWAAYQQQFLRQFMLQVLDIRDALEGDRFVQYHFDPVAAPKLTMKPNPGDSSGGHAEGGTIATIPPPVLAPHMWTESDASTFRVRGGTYNADKVKVPSAPSLFKLVAIDLFEVPEATRNISAHPRNRVHMALQRSDPAWVFVVNIMVPGPPFLSFVAYFQGDPKLIDADTPFGRVARRFFNGNDDEERNNRFKLIPKILDGNLIIKMAVKDTPTLLGNKLKQYYFKGDNYFELDVDVGSSSVARNIVGLAMGYSKAIVVDMGFCLQGNEEDELPEVLMGGCTCIHVDAGTAKKL